MRIAYLIEGMYNAGGMERVVTQKANWLASEGKMDITIVTFAQSSSQADFFSLHEKVKRVRLLSTFKDVNVFKILQEDLTLWLKKNPQDICISTYGREFRVLPKIKDGSKKIVEFHFTYDINRIWMANGNNRIVTTIMGYLKTLRMTLLAKRFDKIVVLTKADEKRWNSKKVVQIYNPNSITSNAVSECTNKTVVAVGRMDRLKGFDMLLECWKIVESRHTDWQLLIYGGGDYRPYKKQAEGLGLKNVEFMGRTSDITSAYINGSIFVSSSRTEGFPLSICEAMTCGLPIVTFDCPSGPAELVENGRNGYIVKRVGDIKTMANMLSKLMYDYSLRYEMGLESKRMSEFYDINNIMNQWDKLFNEVIYGKETKNRMD